VKKLTRRFRTVAAFLFFIIFTAAVRANAQDIRLIIRGDDMGMTQGSLIAFEKAFNVHTAAKDIQVDGGVGLHRAEVLKMLTSIEMKSIILKRDIELTNYRQLVQERNKKAGR